MQLSDYDLRQIDSEYLRSLPKKELQEVSIKLLSYAKETRDRLNQNPNNSSRPPSSQEPWVKANFEDKSECIEKEESDEGSSKLESDKNFPDDIVENDSPAEEESLEENIKKNPERKKSKRKAGKQKGAPGFGRTQKLPLTGKEIHRATLCAACNAKLTYESEFVALSGHYVVDVEMGDLSHPGISLTNTKHTYGDTRCACGHITRTEPYRCPKEEEWSVDISQWHLVGSGLMSLIICLSLRMRLSRARIQEFLYDWLHLRLSIGTINQCIHEGGRAVEPLEEQIIEEIVSSDLLHADETSWKESGQPLWMWVFTTITVTLYVIGSRGKTTIEGLLGNKFFGWLMSDGYVVYRSYKNRLRCWAHLIRKAQGLKESVNNEASLFGNKTLVVLNTLMKAIYQAREGPGLDLSDKYNDLLKEFGSLCEQYKHAAHKKTRDLAGEFLNDWEAIFLVLKYPHLPLTNNEAERALRHWVIARKLSYGTRSKQGSRAFALLASVIDTCRKRDVSTWTYLAEVITARRSGGIVPLIPAV